MFLELLERHDVVLEDLVGQEPLRDPTSQHCILQYVKLREE